MNKKRRKEMKSGKKKKNQPSPGSTTDLSLRDLCFNHRAKIFFFFNLKVGFKYQIYHYSISSPSVV